MCIYHVCSYLNYFSLAMSWILQLCKIFLRGYIKLKYEISIIKSDLRLMRDLIWERLVERSLGNTNSISGNPIRLNETFPRCPRATAHSVCTAKVPKGLEMVVPVETRGVAAPLPVSPSHRGKRGVRQRARESGAAGLAPSCPFEGDQ